MTRRWRDGEEGRRSGEQRDEAESAGTRWNPLYSVVSAMREAFSVPNSASPLPPREYSDGMPSMLDDARVGETVPAEERRDSRKALMRKSLAIAEGV